MRINRKVAGGATGAVVGAVVAGPAGAVLGGVAGERPTGKGVFESPFNTHRLAQEKNHGDP